MNKISYFPYGKSSNQYLSRLLEIIDDNYQKEDVSLADLISELKSFNFKRRDLIIINWFENLFLDNKGKVKFKKSIVAFLKFLVIRLKYKKLIYVRHNVYPHHIHNGDEQKIKIIIKTICYLSSTCIVHSPIFHEYNEEYVPHPLYKSVDLVPYENKKRDPDLYLIFGRIVRYKKIDALIKSFPNNKKLIVIGACEDQSYISELNGLVAGKNNIVIKSGFMEDSEVKKYFSIANGLILSHSDDDMIVSGSFFYALTMGMRILCVETPFLKWAHSVLGGNVAECFKTIEELNKFICTDYTFTSFTIEELDKIHLYFSDETVRASLLNILKRNVNLMRDY
ncbi:TPA: glycosyltransferase family 4 protein [Klebsiella pneumoniae]|nr:glycosyltransferase family 4 protein [Klebsiella pneumoniae]